MGKGRGFAGDHPLMASPVIYRRRPTASPVRKTEGHGRSRSRRARRRQLASRSGYGGIAVVVLVVAASASLLTSIYLLSIIS